MADEDEEEETSPLEVALLEQLTCPVCLELCNAPIHMCINGHNFCVNCRPILTECAICRAACPPTNRNRALEQLSDQILTVPCQYRNNGCGIKRKRQEELEEHHKECKFKVSYKCLVTATCDFQGGTSALYEHVRAKHRTAIRDIGYEYSVDFKKARSKTLVTLMKLEGDEHFWVICKHDVPSSQAYVYIRHIGRSDETRKRFLFIVSLIGKSTVGKTTRSKIISRSYVRESLYLNEHHWSSEHCLVLKRNAINPYQLDTGVIRVNRIV